MVFSGTSISSSEQTNTERIALYLYVLRGAVLSQLPTPPHPSPDTLNLVIEKFLLLVPISEFAASKMKLFKSRKMINSLIKPNSKFAFPDEDFLKGGSHELFFHLGFQDGCLLLTEGSELAWSDHTFGATAMAVLTRRGLGSTCRLSATALPSLFGGTVVVVSPVVGPRSRAVHPGLPEGADQLCCWCAPTQGLALRCQSLPPVPRELT